MRRLAAVAGGVALLVCLAGYGWADAADLVPGPLTARAAPPPRRPVAYPTVRVPQIPPPPVAVTEPAAVDPAALAARLEPVLGDPALGPSVSVSVRDLRTGEQLYSRSADVPRVPASTAKVLTAAVALQTLGADDVARTTTTWLAGSGRPGGRPAVVLRGGGDVLLGAGAGDPAEVVGRAGLADLADATARALLAREGAPTSAGEATPLLGAGAVDVLVDDSLLGGRPVAGRAPGDASFAAPPVSLALDAGRLGAAGRDPDPAGSVGRVFATALADSVAALGGDGAAIGPVSVTTSALPPGVPLGEIESAPLADVIAFFLATSDNTVADAVAGRVAASQGRATDLGSAGAAVSAGITSALAPQQVAVTLADGSGLSAGSNVSAEALTAVLAAATVAPDGDDRRLLPTLLPVAGLDGTVADRFSADGSAAAARGVARSKTGTLSGVTTLSGVVTAADGRGLAFALMADAVPAGGVQPARDAVDRALAAIAGCC